MTAPQNNHSQDHDFRQLTGAFDRPIAPSPNFADALKKRVHEEETRMQQLQSLPVRPISNRTARVTAQPLPGRRPLDIAIAAAVIIGMLASTFWYANTRIGDDGPLPPEATHYAAQPLSSASTPEPQPAMTSDPGDTNSFPAGFDPSMKHQVRTLEGLPAIGDYGAITGDTLVVAVPLGDDPKAQLFAVDLTSGSLKWTSPLVTTWHFTVSGDRIFGAFWEPEPSTPASYAMMSLSVETGEILWSGPTIVEFGEGSDVVPPGYARDLFRPVVIGDAVYYTNQEGQVIARDAYRGETLWATPIEQSFEQGNPGQIVGDERFIYAINRQNAIRKLDRHTGEEIGRFQIPDRPVPDYVMDIHLQGETLIIFSHLFEEAFTTSTVDAISGSDGEVLWSQRLGMAGTDISVTDDIVAIPRRVSVGEMEAGVDDVPKEGTYVSFLDLSTGDPVSLYGPSDHGTLVTSASGDVVCINEGMAITCVDMADETPSPVVLDYAPGYESVAPLLYWNDTAIVLDVDDGVTLLRPKDTQPQQAVSAVETEARGGFFGAASDRSLVNLDVPGPGNPQEMAWSVDIADPLWSLAYGDVVATLGSSEVAVHNAVTGDVLWSKPTTEAFRNSTYDTDRDPRTSLSMRSRPIAMPWIEGDTMYWTTTTELIGVDLYTGEETFRALHTIPNEDLEHTTLLPADMAVREGVAYLITEPLSTTGPTLFLVSAIHLGTGETLWEHTIGDPEGDIHAQTPRPVQLVVTETVVAMQLAGDESSILALNAADGSVLWQEATGLDGYSNIAYSNLSAVADQYLVLTHRAMPTGTTDGTPNADQSLDIRVYTSEDGYLLSSAREGSDGWAFPERGTGACALAIGWTSSVLSIPCTTDDKVYLFEYPLSGGVRLVGQWETNERAFPTYYDSRSVFLSTTDSIFRIDYSAHEMTEIPLTGGETCNAGLPYAMTTVVCASDDGLGTYTLQVFRPVSSATPVASPATSSVQQDARNALLTNDPGNTNAWPAGYDPAQSGELAKLQNIRVQPTSSVIAGDTLIVSGRVNETWIAEQRLTFATQAIDLATGDELWYIDTGLIGPLVVDDWAVYGQQTDADYLRTGGQIVSLSLETGAMNWMIQPLAPTPDGNAGPDTSLLMIGTYLYVPFPNGSVIAYNQRGEVEWAHETGQPLPVMLADDGVPVAGDENAIYIGGFGGEITKLDRLTGELLDTFPVDAGKIENSWTDVYVRNDRLVAIVNPPGSEDRPQQHETVIAMSAETGEVRWSHEIDYQTGNALLTDSMLVVPQYVFDTEPWDQMVIAYDLESGEVIRERKSVAMRIPTLSASGDIVCVFTSRVECGDLVDMERVSTGVTLPDVAGFNPPVMFWDGQIVVVNYETGVYVSKEEVEPIATAE